MKEKDLITQAKNKDAAAISKLYDQNITYIYRFAYYKTGLKEIAEDIASEAFVKAFENIEKFKEKSSFRTWVYVIARNLIFAWYKHKGFCASLNYEPADKIDEEIETGPKSEELLNRIFSKIENERYKKVLELRYLMNFSIKETADELKISSGNVKVIQNRALKKAREIGERLKINNLNLQNF